MSIVEEYKEAFYAFLLLTPAERQIVTRRMNEMLTNRKQIAENVCVCR